MNIHIKILLYFHIKLVLSQDSHLFLTLMDPFLNFQEEKQGVKVQRVSFNFDMMGYLAKRMLEILKV